MSELRIVPPLPTPIHGAGAGGYAGSRIKDEGVRGDERGAAEAAVLRGKEGSLTSETVDADLKPSASEDPLTLTPAAPAAPSGLVRGSGRAADVVAFEEAVVSYFVEGAEVLGVPKSVAAIYGICFASPEPLSFSEINGRLEISSGSVSQGLRVLKEVGALKVVSDAAVIGAKPLSVTGGSGDQITNNLHQITAARSAARYTPDLELRNLVVHWIETRLQKQLKSGEDRISAILASIPAGPGGEPLCERIGHLQNWQNKARALVPVIKTFLKLG